MSCVVLMFFCPQLLGKRATLQWDGNIFRMAPDRYGPEGREQFANDWWRHWFGGFGLTTGGVFGKSQLSSCFPLTVVTCAKLIWETLQFEITNQNTTKEKYTEIFGCKRRKFLKSLQWCVEVLLCIIHFFSLKLCFCERNYMFTITAYFCMYLSHTVLILGGK